MPSYPRNHYIKSQTKRNRERHNNPRHLDEILPASSVGHWSLVSQLSNALGRMPVVVENDYCPHEGCSNKSAKKSFWEMSNRLRRCQIITASGLLGITTSIQ
jgi:hypothetical protein